MKQGWKAGPRYRSHLGRLLKFTEPVGAGGCRVDGMVRPTTLLCKCDQGTGMRANQQVDLGELLESLNSLPQLNV